MGNDENLNASISHIVLGCVSSSGISRMSGKSFTHPGMHANFFIHSVLGFLHYQSRLLDNDFATAYTISYKATRYLALPCLMADLYASNHSLSSVHLISGLVPFALFLSGNDNAQLGNLVVACNLISLAYYSLDRNNEWGWYTCAGGILAYYLSPNMGPKLMYPLGLALMEYCAYRLFYRVYDDSPPPPPGRR